MRIEGSSWSSCERSCPGATRVEGTIGPLGTARGDIAAALPQLRQCWVSSGASASPRGCLAYVWRKNAEFLLPAPSQSSTEPIEAFVIEDSQSLSSTVVFYGGKSVFGAGWEAGCVWGFGAKGICAVPTGEGRPCQAGRREYLGYLELVSVVGRLLRALQPPNVWE